MILVVFLAGLILFIRHVYKKSSKKVIDDIFENILDSDVFNKSLAEFMSGKYPINVQKVLRWVYDKTQLKAAI
jgi:hypothetical protein